MVEYHFSKRSVRMSIAKKIRASVEKGSMIRKMFEEGNRLRALYGVDNVFDFSIGNPNLEPPAKFKQVLKELAADPRPGLHGYPSNAGSMETRQAVAEYLNKYNKGKFTGEDVVITVGAGGALNVIFKTILDPGDEVMAPKPLFVEYPFYADNYQSTLVPVATRADFGLDLDAMDKAFTEKTKAVLINSPHNPTGKVYSKKDIEGLAALLTEKSRKYDRIIYLVADEPYRRIVYDGVKVPSIFDAYPNSFVATSFSKDLSLPGERIGYAAANPQMSEKKLVVDGMILCNRIIGYVNAPIFMQRAVIGLMDECVDVSVYKRRRDVFYNALTSFGYELTKPEGAFYLFPKAPGGDDVAFVTALKKVNILVVPGSGFMGPGYFRISYCVADETINRALPGFEKAIKQFSK
jgi:aspartate aminotransferase